jgi:hypothetical protein
MILLTGNSMLHPVIIGFAGVPVSWLGWVSYMVVRGQPAGGDGDRRSTDGRLCNHRRLKGLLPALLVHTAVQIHYLLPFQQVTILLDAGKAGRYGSRETLRYGLLLTALTILVMLLEVAWWQVAGLIR